MIDQGWASGLAGTAKSRTDDAPMGATSQASSAGPQARLRPISAVTRIPAKAPAAERATSPAVTGPRRGRNVRSQATAEGAMVRDGDDTEVSSFWRSGSAAPRWWAGPSYLTG
jgi:hypothetical protein